MINDPLYNHIVFGSQKGKGGNIGKSDEKLIADLISIHNAENWLGMDGDSELSMFKKNDCDDSNVEICDAIDIASEISLPPKLEKRSKFLSVNHTLGSGRLKTDGHKWQQSW